MATIKDTYVLETQTGNFQQLQRELAVLEANLKRVREQGSQVLGDPKLAAASQQQVERLVQRLKELETAQKELATASSQADFATGRSNLNITKTAQAMAAYRSELKKVASELQNVGNAEATSAAKRLEASVKAARIGSVRRVTSAAAANAGGLEAFARQQIQDKEISGALAGIRGVESQAGATTRAAGAIVAGGLDKQVRDSTQLVSVLRQLSVAAAKANLTEAELIANGRKLVEGMNAISNASTKATGALKAQEEAAAKLANAVRARIEADKASRAQVAEQVNDLRKLGKASEDAAAILNRLAGFSKLGGDFGTKAFKDLAEILSTVNLRADAQQKIGAKVVESYQKQAAAAQVLSRAMDEEVIQRARLNRVAAAAAELAIRSGVASPSTARAALEATQKRIENGELRTTQQIQEGITAQLKAQGELKRGAAIESRIQLATTLGQRQEQAELTRRMTEFARATGLAAKLGGDLRAVISQTVAEVQSLGLSLKTNTRGIQELLRANAALKTLEKTAGPSSLNDFGIAFAAGFAAQNITRSLEQAANRFIEFEDELIKVRRTAGATRTTMANLGEEILDIGQQVPIAVKGLATAAAALGQTGAINFDPNHDFARNTAELQDAAKAIKLVGEVSLVSEVDLETAARSYGQFASVFDKDARRITQVLKDNGNAAATTADAMRSLFGSINTVGNQTVATTSDLLDFSRQFAGVATSLGLQAEQVFALGGAFRNFAVSADVAGTAAVRFFSRATTESDKFGKVLGITGDSFRAAFSADALGTIVKVFEVLKQQSLTNKLAITDFFKSIKAETREQNAFTKPIENIKEFTRLLGIGQNAVQNYQSVSDEAAKRSETFSASITKLSNAWQALIQRAAPLVDVISKLISKFADVVKFIADQAWTTFAVGLGIIAAGVAAVTLNAVKMTFQFVLAAKAIGQAVLHMRELNAEIARRSGINVAPVAGAVAPAGGPTAGTKLLGAAAGVATVTSLLLLTESFSSAGSAHGEAYTGAFNEAVDKNNPTDKLAAQGKAIQGEVEKTTSSTGRSFLEVTAIISTGLIAVTALFGPLAAAAKGAYAVLASGAAASGTALAAMATAGAGAVAVIGVAVAAAGVAVGTLINKVIVSPIRHALDGTNELNAELERLAKTGAEFERNQLEISKGVANQLKGVTAIETSLSKQVALAQNLINNFNKLQKVGEQLGPTFESSEEALKKLLETTDLKKANEIKKVLDEKLASDRDVAAKAAEALRASLTKLGSEVSGLPGLSGDGIFSDLLLGDVPTEELMDNAVKKIVTALPGANKRIQDAQQRLAEVREQLPAAERKAFINAASGTSAAFTTQEELSALREQEKGARQALIDATQAQRALLDAKKKLEAEGEGTLRAAAGVASTLEATIQASSAADKQSLDHITRLERDTQERIRKDADALVKSLDRLKGSQLDVGEKLVNEVVNSRRSFLDGLGKIADEALSFKDPAKQTEIFTQVKELAAGSAAVFQQELIVRWGAAVKRGITTVFNTITKSINDFFEIEDFNRRVSERAQRESIRGKQAEIRALDASIEKINEQKKAYDTLASAIDDLNSTAVEGFSTALKDVDSLTVTFDTRVNKLAGSIVSLADNYEVLGESGVDAFDAVRKAAEGARKATQQESFNFGIKAGEAKQAFDERDKSAGRTLTTSSTARDLVSNVQTVLRQGGTLTQQGAAIGELIAKAKTRFSQQDIDAEDFLTKLQEELANRFVTKAGTTPQDELKNTIETVGKTTNGFLEQIAKALDVRSTGGTGNDFFKPFRDFLDAEALRNVGQGIDTSNLGGPSGQARRTSTELGRAAAEQARTRSGIGRTVGDVQSRLEAARDAANAQAEAVKLALEQVIRESGDVTGKTGVLAQEDLDKVKERLKTLLGSPEFTDVLKGVNVEGLLQGLDIPALSEVVKKAQETFQQQQVGGVALKGLTEAGAQIEGSTEAQQTAAQAINNLAEKVSKFATAVDWNEVAENASRAADAVDEAVTTSGDF